MCGAAGVGVPLDARASSFRLVYSFAGGGDGATPQASLVSYAGTLYGTTIFGGVNTCSAGCGTVFSVNPATGAETVLHRFGASGDGFWPASGLIAVGGLLYGTTSSGGTANAGTVFAVNPATGAETVVYSFKMGNDGAYPNAGLISLGKMLYGTTSYGGPSDNGTVFALNTKTGRETVLHSFAGGADGATPFAGLAIASLTLYGTTTYGGQAGSFGQGIVFSVDPKTKAETVVYAFQDGNDGAYPYAGLIDAGGTLYGTTAFGGASSRGTVYKVSLKNGAEAVITSFENSVDGGGPKAGLLNFGGKLYGTDAQDGADGNGTIFSLKPSTGAVSVVHAFEGYPGDGVSPLAGVIDVGGVLYGTASGGGANNLGAIFAVTP
jgi:uncharacterized repeat protein (TIGR03803 family)